MWRTDIEVPNLPVDMSSWGRLACYPRRTFYPMSDDPPMRNHRITCPAFAPGRLVRSHSQAPLYHYTLRTITKRYWGYLWKPPLLFWRRPPQSNYPPRTVLRQGIRTQIKKGWYFNDDSTDTGVPASKSPTYPTHFYSKSMWSYSKGARGLFVPLRVIGIFTDTSISPRSWLRQCPDRYTIRAGRNLPDKEFRYLRTVIVTAAVYWGFSQELRLR